MHKILIVDDERPARNLIAELVARHIPDSKITQADSAQNALRCMQTDHYDLLFVDIEMPDMSGLQLLENIQVREGDIPPYAFIITAFRKYEYAVKGFRLGVLDYIEKPLHNEIMQHAAKLYLERINSETIELKVAEGVNRIQISQLGAIKTLSRRKVMIYTSNDLLPEVNHSLTELHERLPSNFRYIKRDCVVNIHEVKHYNPKTREITIVSQNRKSSFIASRTNMKEIVGLLNNAPNLEKNES